jgi:gamma-glutamylcyclotransferase (GGCT)/AIG2-like uncharacterized protein YtfP
MYYYAYGSNISTRYLHDYCPSATFVMKADLPNYRVDFLRYSTDMQGGISSITEAPGHLVHGVIYEVSKEDVDELDILEDIPKGLYKRETYLVLGEETQWHEADLYRVVTPSGPYAPAKQYIDYMIEGAKEHGLDADYINKLKTLRNSLDK